MTILLFYLSCSSCMEIIDLKNLVKIKVLLMYLKWKLKTIYVIYTYSLLCVWLLLAFFSLPHLSDLLHLYETVPSPFPPAPSFPSAPMSPLRGTTSLSDVTQTLPQAKIQTWREPKHMHGKAMFTPPSSDLNLFGFWQCEQHKSHTVWHFLIRFRPFRMWDSIG